MKFNLKFISHTFRFLFIIPALSFAQNDSIKNLGDQDIVVVKDYVPTLTDANKISDSPKADTALFSAPDLKYNVEPKKFNTVYTVTPIKPVRIKDENIKKLYRGFLKGGYGTHNTTYAEVFYNALRSKEFDAGIHFTHLASTGTIADYGYTDNSNNALELNGKKYVDLGILSANVALIRSVVHYYGYNHNETIYSKSETRQRFQGAAGGIDFTNNNNDKQRWDIGAGINFYGYSGQRLNNDTKEGNFIAKAFLGKHFDDDYASAGLNLDYTKLTQPLTSEITNTVFKFEPRYKLKISMFDLTAGLNFAYESTDKSKLHMYPHAHLSYTIGEDVMKVYAQLSGNFQKNSYKNITSENPFTGDVIGVANANTKIDLRAGMDVRLDKEISFNGFAAFMRIKNQMFFVNNPQFSTEPITFGAAYDNADVLNLHGEIQLHKNDKAQFYIKGDYFSYSPDSLEKPWYKPSVQFTLSGNYSMQDKIILKADLFYHGSVFIPDYLTEKKYSELNGWFDASLAIEYRYTKVLSVFLNLNNISATRYYRWYNYPSYRFNALAGLTYSF